MLKRHRREFSILAAIITLLLVLAIKSPGYFSRENLEDLFVSNVPVLIVALGMTLVIITGQIDISVGSIFAIASVAAGELVKLGLPTAVAAFAACGIGAGLGAINGSLTAYAKLPSIVVTLATMVALRDGLRWITQGEWVQDLPANFQWFGLSQQLYPLATFLVVAILARVLAWSLRNVAAGRAVYAAGSNPEAARLAGVDVALVTCCAFVVLGTLTGFAAVVNAVRFHQVPSNAGIGLELKVIAAVVVGGASITGGRGTIAGTILGVILLAAIGPALTFLGASAYWERAIQGAIILISVSAEGVWAAMRSRIEKYAPA